MKTINIFLIFALLFGWVISPAHAQEADGTYKFIPLVTEVDADTPLWVQAQQAYDQLLPKLTQAKKKGEILEWQPEINVGILSIKYAANGVHSQVLGTLHETDDFHTALALVPHTANLNSASEGDGGNAGPIFELTLYSNCFRVYNLPADAYVRGMLYDKTGKLLATSLGQYDSADYFLDCFNYGQFQYVFPGYKITYKIYDKTNTILLGTYKVTAPTLEITSLKQSQGIVAGHGPANKSYYVDWFHVYLGNPKTGQEIIKEGRTSALGEWSQDMSDTLTIRGGDYLKVAVQPTPHFTFVRYGEAPYMSCNLGGMFCSVQAMPFQKTTITLTRAGVPIYTSTYQTESYGGFTVNFLDAQNTPILLAKGDRIDITDVPSFTLPNLTANINFATDVISGAAPMQSRLTVAFYDVSSNLYFKELVSSAASKNYYMWDVTSLIDLKEDQAVDISLYYIDKKTGDSVYTSSAYVP